MAHERKVMRPRSEPAMMMTVIALRLAGHPTYIPNVRETELVVAAVSLSAWTLLTPCW